MAGSAPEDLLAGADANWGAPEAPEAPDVPMVRPPQSLWEAFVRGWRPLCGYLCALMLVRGVAVPLVQLARRDPVEVVDWTAFAAIASVLVLSRTFERYQGVA